MPINRPTDVDVLNPTASSGPECFEISHLALLFRTSKAQIKKKILTTHHLSMCTILLLIVAPMVTFIFAKRYDYLLPLRFFNFTVSAPTPEKSEPSSPPRTSSHRRTPGSGSYFRLLQSFLYILSRYICIKTLLAISRFIYLPARVRKNSYL